MVKTLAFLIFALFAATVRARVLTEGGREEPHPVLVLHPKVYQADILVLFYYYRIGVKGSLRAYHDGIPADCLPIKTTVMEDRREAIVYRCEVSGLYGNYIVKTEEGSTPNVDYAKMTISSPEDVVQYAGKDPFVI